MRDDSQSGKRRDGRKRIGIVGRYRTGSGIARDVWITDLSRGGCRFFDRFGTMQPGKSLTLRIGTIGPIEAKVRWWESQVNGVEFRQPLHESVYAHICANLSECPPADLESWEDEEPG